jgi:myo-inositol-1(or 4)-monophosphatase
MYWAKKGDGAYRNGRKMQVLNDDKLKNTYLDVGAFGRDLGFSSSSLFEILGEQKCKVMKFPSFIYGGIQVANGKYVGAIFYGKFGHDVAALKIITEEAGGKVTDLYGNERRYDQDGLGCIISNGVLHEELLRIVQAGKNS